jgi:hypothetical protein
VVLLFLRSLEASFSFNFGRWVQVAFSFHFGSSLSFLRALVLPDRQALASQLRLGRAQAWQAALASQLRLGRAQAWPSAVLRVAFQLIEPNGFPLLCLWDRAADPKLVFGILLSF